MFLVKGVNKTIIEVANTENEYFERILFIVNSDALSLGDKKLKQEAQNILGKYEFNNVSTTPLRKLYIKRKRNILIASVSCSVLIIAIFAIIGLFL